MYFDIAMPLTLFSVTMVAMFLNNKVEKKLKMTFEEREFGVKNAVMLVAAISVAVSLMVFVPQMAVMTIFLLAYAALLFIFTYIFSDLRKIKAQFFCAAFLIISFIAATVSLFSVDALGGLSAYGAAAFYCLFGFSFLSLAYEETKTRAGRRWYLAALPSTLFIILYAFYSRSPIWFPYLLNMYGVVFAVLVILYLGALFTWKTTLIFAGLLTVADIILVLVTGTMVSAATHVSGLRLPVLVILPTVPAITTSWGKLYMSLGLGDFFFAGLIAVQTYKKYGRQFAVLSAVAMAVSFFIFEALILTFKLRAFPGTLMIICGWLPLPLLKFLKSNKICSVNQIL
ncbi:MAG: hypothetical protein QXN95_02580 [Candidatus Bathyarchaeia archaeon]